MMAVSRASLVRANMVRAAIGAAAVAVALAAPAAGAQDLVHHFIDPSFGGNPFYSDHLLAVAAIDRPAAPTTPSTTPTQEELIAQQLRAQLLSQLSGDILDQIRNAPVGGTGNFEFGNQQVSYTRGSNGTTVTFTNTTTGQVNTIVIPPSSGSGSGAAPTTAASATADARLAASAAGARTVAAATIPTGQSLTSGTSAVALGRVSGSASAEQTLLASSGSRSGGSVLPPY